MLRFTDVFSAWLALINKSYVNELKRDSTTRIKDSCFCDSALPSGTEAGTPQIGLSASRVIAAGCETMSFTQLFYAWKQFMFVLVRDHPTEDERSWKVWKMG